MRIEINGWKLAAAIGAVPIGLIAFFNQYQKRYIAPPEINEREFPGDEFLSGDDVGHTTLCIDIAAPPEKIWPLINQIGQHKAGFYSFACFEQLTHFKIYNTYTPQARWQDTKVGDWCFFGPQGIGMEWMQIEPGKYLVGRSDSRHPPKQDGAIAWLPAGTDGFAWTWGFFLEELDDGTTRLISRSNSWAHIVNKYQALAVAGLMWGWSSGVMTTRMLEVIKACAEDKWFLKL